MNNLFLITKKTYFTTFNKLSKILISLIVLYGCTALFIGLLTLEPTQFPNHQLFNLAFVMKNIVVTFFVFFIIKKNNQDLKKGYLKNLLVNNFTKQNYYFGVALAWYSIVLLVNIINFIILYVVWSVETGFPTANLTTYVLFIFFYFFFAPSILYWFLLSINYLFFAHQKYQIIMELGLLFFTIISLIWIMIFTIQMRGESSYWQNYFYFILPFYNLIFSVPQEWSLNHITYWWVYLIDGIYLLVLIPIFYFCLPKSKIIFNGIKTNKYFG